MSKPIFTSTMAYFEIESIEQCNSYLASSKPLNQLAFQNIDFCKVSPSIKEREITNCLFLGCKLPDGMRCKLTSSCMVFPNLKVPYNCFRSTLYNAWDLYKGYNIEDDDSFERCFDTRVYQHYLRLGKRTSDIGEHLARSLHDLSITDAMYDFLEQYDEKMVVGIMGGHGLMRTEPIYRDIIEVAKDLTERGFLLVSGGGPGAMEATHVGAWMAGRTAHEVDEAVAVLSSSPTFHDEGWLHTALQVIRDYPQKHYHSLGIPTWLYGHEPSTPFATHIAKYFTNSIREDEILTIANGGIIYTPGSAGTMQEIFQDAVQNHYLSFGYASPMIFLGKDYWTKEMPVYNLLSYLTEKGKYKNLMLTITDDIQEVVDVLTGYPFGKR